MRKPIVGLSQKIYNNTREHEEVYLHELKEKIDALSIENIDLFYFPSLGVLETTSAILKDHCLKFGAQNIAPIFKGAMTGEYSLETLIDIGGRYVEVGHAERKRFLLESSQLIRDKLVLTLRNGLTPVLCIGEESRLEIEDRKKFYKEELSFLLGNLDRRTVKNIVIAYEPVWAIGQEEAAETNYIYSSHHAIRNVLKELFGEMVSQEVRIIYGGSVSKENAPAIVENESVDGVFIGRFGHNPSNFAMIIDIVNQIKNEEEI